jgi:hypothetical protein
MLVTQLSLQLQPELHPTTQSLAADSTSYYLVVQMLLEYRITDQAFLESNVPGDPPFSSASRPAKPVETVGA